MDFMKLSITDWTFGYQPDEMLFKNVALLLESGNVLSILGANGCGKTTLIKTLVGILNPHIGRIVLNDEDITGNSSRCSFFGYVQQVTDSPLPYTAFNMVLMGRARFINLFSRPRSEDIGAAEEAMKEMGIIHLRHRSFSRLSGGERQLVLIARAIASGAKILVFDEPTSALDVKNQYHTLKMIHKLAHLKRYLVIFTTHDPVHALQVSDYSLIMKKGTGHRFGVTEEVLTEANIDYAYGIDVKICSIPHCNCELKAIAPVMDLQLGT